MKSPLAAILLFSTSLAAPAQNTPVARSTAPPQAAQTMGPNLNSILADVQRAAISANGDLGKLRIDKWKTDGAQKQQMQQVSDSLQRNITAAIPGLITDLQATPGSVSKAFKLYHNLNVVYEFLSSLAEAAGAFGKKEEYEPLAADAAALDKVRQNLSGYIEQTATNLEAQIKKPPPATPAQTTQSPPKKIVVDEGNIPAKKKKKTASTPPQ